MTEDTVYVLTEAADGPVFVPFTRDEYAQLTRGVDVEAASALEESTIEEETP